MEKPYQHLRGSRKLRWFIVHLRWNRYEVQMGIWASKSGETIALSKGIVSPHEHPPNIA